MGSITSRLKEKQTTQASPSSSIAAASAVVDSQDLLRSILVRLPAKTLIRFKSVSKHWFSLISDPHFCLLHTLQNPNLKPTGIFFHPKPSTTEYEFVSLSDPNHPTPPFKLLDFVDDPLGILILQSCNGLFLCYNRRLLSESGVQYYYIYNPTTKRFSILDPPEYDDPGVFSSYLTRVQLAFDPSKSIHYKVVMIKREDWSENSSCWVHVYSSETRTWRSCENEFEYWGPFVWEHIGVFWNGSIHWITKTKGSICLDVDGECERRMPSLPETYSDNSIRHLCESGDHLHVIDIQGLAVMKIFVYELVKDYSQWQTLYRVDLNNLLVTYPSMILARQVRYFNFSLVTFVREDEEEKSSLVLRLPGELISYSFSDGSIKQLHSSLPGEVNWYAFWHIRCLNDGHIFLETLACV